MGVEWSVQKGLSFREHLGSILMSRDAAREEDSASVS
jgi:hypothetical protein